MRLAILSLLLLSYFSAASAADLDRMIDVVMATHQFKEVALAPDGSQVAWVESWPLNEDKYQNRLFVSSTRNPSPRAIAVGVSQDQHGLTWAPDGTHLAFLADEANNGKITLHILDPGSGNVRRLAAFAGDPSSPKWSPDGSKIAVLVKASPAKKLDVVGDWINRDTVPQTIVLVSPVSGQIQKIGQSDLSIYEYDWSPDGKHIAATGAKGDANDNWWYAKLYRIDLTGNRTAELLTPEWQIADPVWSSDGRSIAYIGGLMSDFIAPGGDIFVVPAAGGAAVNITPGLHGSATWLAWRKPEEVLFTEDVDGASAIATATVAPSSIHVLWEGQESISTGGLVSGMSASSNGAASAAIRQTFVHAPEIWAGPTGDWRQITQVNRGLKPQWGEAKSQHWNNGPQPVQGWLLYPKDYSPTRKYPLVVLVHGGPAGDSATRWAKPFYNMEVLSGLGYFVFYPNARGSLGFGESFTRANVKDLGYGDFGDITSGVESLLNTLPVDRNRVGITGWSYGGYMAMWAGTQTHLFRASVAGPGVSDWQSYYGQVDIEKWLLPYFGASVYDDPQIYARSSPINFIKQAKTPTMMFAGEVDNVCPTPQSFELWRGLEHMDVPTSLVIYQRETHGLAIPRSQRAVTKATAAWFQKYLVPLE
jgi:dipeptidyl aminopeptidase/acylaminoacyl peptidase